MAVPIDPAYIEDFWRRFVIHREADQGNELAKSIEWRHRALWSPRNPSPLDRTAFADAVIEFGRSYMPDVASWRHHLERAGISQTGSSPMPVRRFQGALSEEETLMILEAEDMLAANLSELMRDDLEAWLISKGFAPDAAHEVRSSADKLLPQTPYEDWP